jgi:hypothetical protein
MPTPVNDIIGYAGLSARQTDIVRFLERDRKRGFTAHEIAEAIQAPPMVGRLLVKKDLALLSGNGRIREGDHRGKPQYFAL